ncbi:MAG: efflux RND transporter periplasmic adaptor subunit [Geminicoccaceae bacterium]|nr:efflux RND transporter periplasmic adaptor subunit [Geminicoccaceae bacterium]
MRVLYQILVVLVLAAVAGAGWFVFAVPSAEGEADAKGGRASRPAAVVVAEAKRGLVQDTIEVVGTTRANRSVDIVPVAAGRIVRIGAQEGREVAAGEVLFELDDAQARAAVREAEATLKNLQGQYDRARRLSSNSVVSEASVDELASGVAGAEARLAAVRAELDDRTIRAPFEGAVGLIDVSVGAYVTAGTVLTTLDDLTPIELQFGVPENFLGRVAPGGTITASAAAFPGEAFEGRIAEIGTRIDPRSRAFTVRASLPNPARRLPEGLFMTADLVLDSRPDAVLVPLESLIAEGPETYVYAVRDGKASRVPVEVGRRLATEAEIRRGLEPGERVVVQGQQRLRDGAAVEVVDGNPKSIT